MSLARSTFNETFPSWSAECRSRSRPSDGRAADGRGPTQGSDHFDVTLTVAGVYDYFCMPHEAAGMVGRVVVGKPAGAGTLPFDYFEGKVGTADWLAVPAAAQRAFPGIERILRARIVPGGAITG